jgi:hypothetical protein
MQLKDQQWYTKSKNIEAEKYTIDIKADGYWPLKRTSVHDFWSERQSLYQYVLHTTTMKTQR